MKLKTLSIRNFRNIENINYIPGSKLNVLVGDNAQGKTNILEAIYVMATGYSFRCYSFNQMVKYDRQKLFLKGEHEYQNRLIETSLEYNIDKIKIFKINNKKSRQNNTDRLRVVLFTPDDLYLVKGNPSKRRSFIDFVVKQLSSEYLYNLDNYVNILKKRNLLLKKEQTNSKTFKIVNDIFSEKAAQVIIARINFINLLEETIIPIYKQNNPDGSRLKIRYAISFPVDSDKISQDIIYNALKKNIAKNLAQEISRKTSLFGPHVDDINIYQNDRLARFFSSQGQQRNIVISLKLAEINLYKKSKGFYPILLLDEVMAELDEEKKQHLLQNLADTGFQTFMTSVSSNPINISDAVVKIVKEGCLIGKG